MENLPLIPIEDSVVFPGMTVTLALEVGDAERVFLVPRHGGSSAPWAPSPRSPTA